MKTEFTGEKKNGRSIVTWWEFDILSFGVKKLRDTERGHTSVDVNPKMKVPCLTNT